MKFLLKGSVYDEDGIAKIQHIKPIHGKTFLVLLKPGYKEAEEGGFGKLWLTTEEAAELVAHYDIPPYDGPQDEPVVAAPPPKVRRSTPPKRRVR
jgi:hypothetical protein